MKNINRNLNYVCEIDKEYMKLSDFFSLPKMNQTINELSINNHKYHKFITNYIKQDVINAITNDKPYTNEGEILTFKKARKNLFIEKNIKEDISKYTIYGNKSNVNKFNPNVSKSSNFSNFSKEKENIKKNKDLKSDLKHLNVTNSFLNTTRSLVILQENTSMNNLAINTNSKIHETKETNQNKSNRLNSLKIKPTNNKKFFNFKEDEINDSGNKTQETNNADKINIKNEKEISLKSIDLKDTLINYEVLHYIEKIPEFKNKKYDVKLISKHTNLIYDLIKFEDKLNFNIKTLQSIDNENVNFEELMEKKFIRLREEKRKKEVKYIFKKIFDKRWEYLMKPKGLENPDDVKEKTKKNKNKNYIKSTLNTNSSEKTISSNRNETQSNSIKHIDFKEDSKVFENRNELDNRVSNKKEEFDKNKNSNSYLFAMIKDIKKKIFFIKSIYDFVYPKIIVDRLKEEDRFFKIKNLNLKLISLQKEELLRNKGVFKLKDFHNEINRLGIHNSLYPKLPCEKTEQKYIKCCNNKGRKQQADSYTCFTNISNRKETCDTNFKNSNNKEMLIDENRDANSTLLITNQNSTNNEKIQNIKSKYINDNNIKITEYNEENNISFDNEINNSKEKQYLNTDFNFNNSLNNGTGMTTIMNKYQANLFTEPNYNNQYLQTAPNIKTNINIINQSSNLSLTNSSFKKSSNKSKKIIFHDINDTKDFNTNLDVVEENPIEDIKFNHSLVRLSKDLNSNSNPNPSLNSHLLNEKINRNNSLEKNVAYFSSVNSNSSNTKEYSKKLTSIEQDKEKFNKTSISKSTQSLNKSKTINMQNTNYLTHINSKINSSNNTQSNMNYSNFTSKNNFRKTGSQMIDNNTFNRLNSKKIENLIHPTSNTNSKKIENIHILNNLRHLESKNKIIVKSCEKSEKGQKSNVKNFTINKFINKNNLTKSFYHNEFEVKTETENLYRIKDLVNTLKKYDITDVSSLDNAKVNNDFMNMTNLSKMSFKTNNTKSDYSYSITGSNATKYPIKGLSIGNIKIEEYLNEDFNKNVNMNALMLNNKPLSLFEKENFENNKENLYDFTLQYMPFILNNDRFKSERIIDLKMKKYKNLK